MLRSQILLATGTAVILLAAIVGYYVWNTVFVACCEPPTPQAVTVIQPSPIVTTQLTDETDTTKTFSTEQLDAAVAPMQFSAEIPAHWQVEYVPEALAVNFYDPAAPGESPLEQSQIFVKFFEASQFLTLQTVVIHGQEDLTINNRPTVRYDIEKRSTAANFAHQPSWRNARHFVTDIRSTDDTPTIFYVFGQNPQLSDETFFAVLDSMTFQ